MLSLENNSLQAIINSFAQKNLYFYIGVELEFYIGNISYKDFCLINLPIVNKYFFNSCIKKEEEEYQLEISILPQKKILYLVDKLFLLREEMALIAKRKSYNIDFSAKPFLAKSGSALHLHINIIDKNNNNLFQANNFLNSNMLCFAIGGLCKYMINSMVYFAPNEASLLRYKYPNIHTPTHLSWGKNNRSAALRLPPVGCDKTKTRIEHRVPCANSNFYDVFSAVLLAIKYGIDYKIAPPPPIYGIARNKQYNLMRLF